MLKMSFDLPLDEACFLVNEALWEMFVEAYKDKYHCPPSPSMWTEESVVQWFDRQDVYNEPVDYSDYDAIITS